MVKSIPSFAVILFFTGMLYAQPVMPKLLYSDFTVVTSDSVYNIFYTYKIPLSHLVFEKGTDLFLAQYRISLEIFNAKKDKFIERAIKEKNIQVADYEQTLSRFIYSEGELELNLNPGSYSVIEIFYDYKSAKEIRSPAKLFNIDTVKNILSPLIVEKQFSDCDKKEYLVLANYGGNLPFDENEYSFIIPAGIHTDSLFVELTQDKDTIFNGKVYFKSTGKLALSECGGKIILDSSIHSDDYKYFSIEGISGKIKEGDFLIKVKSNKKEHKPEIFKFACKWINKPQSLKDPEAAIKALKFIAKDSVISSLLNADSDDYQKELAEYWKNIDPTPLTEFNPLMQEYYERVDYASENFTTVGGSNGANTDRGKIYIKFGKPAEVSRASDEYGNIVETWTYNNSQRKFVFVDKKGTGDFSLISG